MQTIDRYFLRELCYASLGLLLLVACVTFFAQSIRFIDTVVEHNRGFALFGELAVFLLPSILLITLPLAAFVGTLFAIHRLDGDSEISALFAAGAGVGRLLRATATFAAVVAVLTGLFSLYLVPLAARQMESRLHSLRDDLSALLLRDGQFLSPTERVTIYVRWIDRQGTMHNIFVHDARDPEQATTYSAQQAVFERRGERSQLTMFDGSAYTVDGSGEQRSLLRFDQFIYDLTTLFTASEARVLRPREMFVPELFEVSQQVSSETLHRRLQAEAHSQLSAPLYAFTLPFIALAGLLAGSTGSQLAGWRPFAATIAGVVLVVSSFALKSLAIGNPALEWSPYVPPLAVLLLTLAFLQRSGHRRRRPNLVPA